MSNRVAYNGQSKKPGSRSGSLAKARYGTLGGWLDLGPATAEMHVLVARARYVRLARAVSGVDVLVGVARRDGVGAVAELPLVIAVAVADDGGDRQAAGELEVVVAVEAGHVNRGDPGEGLVVDVDVVELAIDLDARAAGLAGADRSDV